MNLDLNNLALFLRVAELGKIARAGEEFGFSSTNTSQRIRQLESEVGVSLFHRSTRVVTLTHDGEVFLEHARRILDDVEEAMMVFRGDAKSVQGKLRISVSSSYGRLYIVPFIPEFTRRYPELEIEIDFSDGLVDVVEQGFNPAACWLARYRTILPCWWHHQRIWKNMAFPNHPRTSRGMSACPLET